MRHDDTSMRVRRTIKNRIDDFRKSKGLDSLNDALERLVAMAELSGEIEELKREIQRLKERIEKLEKKG